MSSGIFLIQDDGELVPMTEQDYDSEDLLQELLARYPDLLAGDQMNSQRPRRWLLVSREHGAPDREGGYDRWAVDHLFLDQDGVPTLVEVKRSTNTQLRREVVGQTAEAENVKGEARHRWDEETFFQTLSKKEGSSEKAAKAALSG